MRKENGEKMKSNKNIRKNLGEIFEKDESKENKSSNLNLFHKMNLSNSKKVFVSGAEKIGNTFKGVQNSFGKLSQRLHFGTLKRQRLTENATPCHTPGTPQARGRQLLGRTPTKLYSPFGIETPRYITDRDHRINPDTPDHNLTLSPRKKRKSVVSWKFMKRRPRALFH